MEGRFVRAALRLSVPAAALLGPAAALLGVAALAGTAFAGPPSGGEDVSIFHLGPENISGTYGKDIDGLYNAIMWLTTITFVLTEGALFAFLFKFRAKEGGKAAYTHGNHKLEMVWTILPGIILFLLAILQLGIWKAIKVTRPDPKSGLVVEVLAKQFEWNFRYAGPDGSFGTEDDVITTNYLHVPANTNVTVLLRSQDVLHAFFLPNIRLKQDTVPGITIPQWFSAAKTTEQGKKDLRARLEAERATLGPRVETDLRETIRGRLISEKRPAGDLEAEVAKALAEKPVAARIGEWIDERVRTFEYEIACAELCGLGHTTMHGYLRVYPEKEFFQWIDGLYLKDVHDFGSDPEAQINRHWPADQNRIKDEWLRDRWPADMKAAWPKKGE